MSENSEPKKSLDGKPLIVPDPNRKTCIDEHGRKYWFTTGYYGRTIKMYGEPWKFRTTFGDVVAMVLIIGLMSFGIYSTLLGKLRRAMVIQNDGLARPNCSFRPNPLRGSA